MSGCKANTHKMQHRTFRRTVSYCFTSSSNSFLRDVCHGKKYQKHGLLSDLSFWIHQENQTLRHDKFCPLAQEVALHFSWGLHNNDFWGAISSNWFYDCWEMFGVLVCFLAEVSLFHPKPLVLNIYWVVGIMRYSNKPFGLMVYGCMLSYYWWLWVLTGSNFKIRQQSKSKDVWRFLN